MDDKTRNEITELILRILLEEILRDGKIDLDEKRIFQKLFKALRVSKLKAEEIHKDVASKLKQNAIKGPLDLKMFFNRLRNEIPLCGISEQTSDTVILRVAKTLEFDLSILDGSGDECEEGMVAEAGITQAVDKPDCSTLEASYQDDDQRPSDPKIWKCDWIKDFANRFSGSTKNTIVSILKSRLEGAHESALSKLQDYSVPMGYEERYLLQARILSELDRCNEAEEILERAKKAGLEDEVYAYELYFLESIDKDPNEALKDWLALNGLENPLPEIAQEGLRQLCLALEGRFKRVLALSQLEAIAQDNQSRTLLDRFRDEAFEDIYFRYYGRGIMLVQLLASMFVVVICIYNFSYVGPAVEGIFIELASGLPSLKVFFSHLGIVLSYSFLFVALLPVAYINGLMLFASYQGKVMSYTESYPGFIRICNFGRIYHLRKKVRDKPLFVYQDDNDYTYISLVRHLPFVPNFTYIYGFDELRGFYALLPLFGVADGYLFKKKNLDGREGKVAPINMLGVRIAQLATVISFLRTSVFFAIPVLLLCIGLESVYMIYATEASIKAYIMIFIIMISSIGILYYTPWIVMHLLSNRFLNLPFTINIIKPGLLALTGFYLLMHYSVYSYSGLIPAACGLAGFYLLFIRTKYPPEKKQIVAYVSSLQRVFRSSEPVVTMPYGLQGLLLGKEITKFGQEITLFFNRDFVVMPGRFSGLTLYYEVINLTSGLKVSLCEIPDGTRLRISNYSYDLDCGLEELKRRFEAVKMPIEIVPIHETGRSKIEFDRVGIIFGVWLIWQLLTIFVDPGYDPKKFQPSLAFMERVVSLLEKRKDSLFHKEEMVEYKIMIRKNEREISIEHKNEITWEQFEDAVRNKYASTERQENQTSSIKVSEFILPAFIKKDGFRDDVLEFLGWALWTHWQEVDSLRYGKELEVYCENFGGAAIKRSKNLVCSFSFGYEHAIQWIHSQKRIPEIFDLTILRELVVLDGNILQFMNKASAMDPDLVTKAVTKDGLLLQYANPRLRIDKNIVLSAIRSNYLAYQFMNPTLFSDITVVSALVEKDGLLLEKVKPALRSKLLIVLKAIKQNHQAYRFMHKSFWRNQDICTELLSKDGLLLEFVDGQLKDRDRLVKLAIMQNGEALKFAPQAFRRDHGVVSMALNNKPSAWKYMDSSLLKHRDLALRVLKEDGLQLAILEEKFRRDPNMVAVAIDQNYRAFHSMDSELWKNQMVVTGLVKKYGLALEFVDPELRTQRDLVKLALKQNGLALEFLPAELKADRNLVLTAVRSNGESLKFAHNKLRGDLDLILEAAKGNLDSIKHALVSRNKLIEESDSDNPAAQILLAYFDLEIIRASMGDNQENQQNQIGRAHV